MIPLIVNVILTFLGVVAVYFNFNMFSFHRSDLHIPYGIVSPEEIYLLLQIPSSNKWILTSIATVLIILIKSYALSMYLGSMKCFLEGPDNTYSILKIAPYYFERMVQFSIIEFLVSCIILLLTQVYWPIAILMMVIALLYSLTPYILVLEDTSIWNALRKSPTHCFQNIGTLFTIAVTSLVVLILITKLPLTDYKMAYYLITLITSFIGTSMIFAVMSCLHENFYRFTLPAKRVKKSRKLFPPLWIVALLLPILGALLLS